MLEIFAIRDRPAFTKELAEELPIDKERVRQILKKLNEERGWVEKNKLSGRNLYRLTEDGQNHLMKELRAALDQRLK
jgi:Mn-dependent DtxR family transcriptional regulator